MTIEVTLVDPNGAEWVAGSAIEINDLLAQGYRVKGSGAPADEPRSTSGPERPSPRPSNVADPAPVTKSGTQANTDDVK